jgi:hypothetical protein
MSYGSKTISYKIASARENAGLASVLGPAVSAVLEERAAALEAGEQVDFTLPHEVIGRALDAYAGQMAELHQRHHHWRARERQDKARLRAAAVALRGHLRAVRHLFDSYFGVRQGVANFPGREDLTRLPMHSLENVAAGLLLVLDDDAFGWSASAFDLEAHRVREQLARLLAGYRAANAGLIESRGQRARAADERQRQVAECQEKVAGMTAILRGLCGMAGYEGAALELRARRPPARRRKKAGGEAPASPTGD